MSTDSTLGALLRQLADRHDSRPAVVGNDASLSFAELDRAADRWARSFLARGFGPGSHIGLLAGNGPEWLAVAFGVWRAGATLVPLSTFVTPHELGEILEHADVNVLVVQPRLRQLNFTQHLDELPALPTLRGVVLLREPRHPAYHTDTRWLQQADASIALPDVAADARACILYTSGTTGRAKGVMLTHRSILATVGPTVARGGLDASDSLLSTLPLFWVAGLVIRALPTLASGCTLLLLETFTVDRAIAALRTHRPTAVHLRPPQVGQILAHPEFEPSLLAAVCKGGGRSAWYAPHMTEARLITGYGMTEMSGYVTALDWQDPPEVRAAQIGHLLPGVELRIVGPDAADCDAGVEGEVLVRGPGMFAGYYKEAAATGRDADGWFRTGDLGSVDAAGQFHFSGRSKDLLRVKGINVSPIEVESVLASHPGVEAAYVVGLPADGLDQQVVALVVSKETRVSDQGLRDLVAERLSSYKRPAAYVHIARQEVPLGGTSKPQRSALADLAAKRLPRPRSAST